tara:strand:- start:111 stop:536 length:426 start_codon:yes stop_codon:yes gene_type:complete
MNSEYFRESSEEFVEDINSDKELNRLNRIGDEYYAKLSKEVSVVHSYEELSKLKEGDVVYLDREKTIFLRFGDEGVYFIVNDPKGDMTNDARELYAPRDSLFFDHPLGPTFDNFRTGVTRRIIMDEAKFRKYDKMLKDVEK